MITIQIQIIQGWAKEESLESHQRAVKTRQAIDLKFSLNRKEIIP